MKGKELNGKKKLEKLERDEKFNSIYEEHKEAIMRTCFVIIKDYHLAQDATQETFIKVYENLDKFEGRSALKTWITKIAINASRDIVKERKKIRECDKILARQQLRGFDIETIDNGISVYSEVQKLPDELREVIMLHYYQEFRVWEIAEMLNLTQSTVKARLAKARDLLREALKEEYDERH